MILMRFFNRYLILVIFFVFNSIQNASSQWIRLKVQGAPNFQPLLGFNDLSFLNADTGIVVGWKNAYLTTDGGIQWKVLPMPALQTYDLYTAIAYIDSDFILVGTSFGYLLKSQNMGMNWTQIPGTFGMLQDILFNSRDTIILATTNGYFYRSFNGAVSFKSFSMGIDNGFLTCQSPVLSPSNLVYAISSDMDGILCPIYTNIHSCPLNGSNCKDYLITLTCASGIQMFNDSSGYIFADYLLETNDNWVTHDTVFSDSSFYAPPINMGEASFWMQNNLHFFDPDTGFIIYNNGEVTYTKDGGHHYQHMVWGPNHKKIRIKEIVCPNRNTCFGLGVTPYVYRFDFDSSFTLPSGMAQIEINNELRAMPNPSTGYFTLHLPVTKGVATLKVYDFSGRVLWQRKYANQASSTISLDLSGTPHGLYLIEWQTEDQSYFGKLMIE